MNTVSINYNYCKGCGICISFCPKNVFNPRKDGKPDVADVSSCIGCKLCVRQCPDFAVKVEVVK